MLDTSLEMLNELLEVVELGEDSLLVAGILDELLAVDEVLDINVLLNVDGLLKVAELLESLEDMVDALGDADEVSGLLEDDVLDLILLEALLLEDDE